MKEMTFAARLLYEEWVDRLQYPPSGDLVTVTGVIHRYQLSWYGILIDAKKDITLFYRDTQRVDYIVKHIQRGVYTLFYWYDHETLQSVSSLDMLEKIDAYRWVYRY